MRLACGSILIRKQNTPELIPVRRGGCLRRRALLGCGLAVSPDGFHAGVGLRESDAAELGQHEGPRHSWLRKALVLPVCFGKRLRRAPRECVKGCKPFGAPMLILTRLI